MPAIAAALLRATRLNLWEDSVLVKEPGSGERTAWHQDLSYFHVSGEKLCTTWVPLDEVDADTGAMSFVRGSHRWPSPHASHTRRGPRGRRARPRALSRGLAC
jgi:ectoine hydroxylase-related dioxygenase (phytanoyl-CoA dioxygenase family)